jgi:hypothetical protein
VPPAGGGWIQSPPTGARWSRRCSSIPRTTHAHAPPHLRVRFHASPSVASEVAYDDTGCDHLSDAETVQEALDALCRKGGILYVGGDGQEALPGEILPAPLRVRVSNGGGRLLAQR